MRAIFHADRKWGIGKSNDLMFSIPKDMKFFRETTKGKVVVMGLNTLRSFPNGKTVKKSNEHCTVARKCRRGRCYGT